MRTYHFIPGFLLMLSLGACSLRDQFDWPAPLPPTIEVSATSAKVGEPIEVSLYSDFILYEQATILERPVHDVLLGACFSSGIAEGTSGLCAPDLDDHSVFPYLQTMDGTTHIRDIGDIVVKRGQKFVVEHTFKFTMTEAGKVEVSPNMQFIPDGYDMPSDVDNTPVEVTFK